MSRAPGAKTLPGWNRRILPGARDRRLQVCSVGEEIGLMSQTILAYQAVGVRRPEMNLLFSLAYVSLINHTGTAPNGLRPTAIFGFCISLSVSPRASHWERRTTSAGEPGGKLLCKAIFMSSSW